MKTIRYEKIEQDARDIPDLEIFTVYVEPPKRSILTTEDNPPLWAFAFKIKKKFTLSSWRSAEAGPDEVMKAKNQILYAKKYGWSNTREEKYDSVGQKAFLYECLFCGQQTCEEEIFQEPCKCRGVVVKPKKSFLDLL